eukprot:562111-Ditylum_brightwellii.AAC.1
MTTLMRDLKTEYTNLLKEKAPADPKDAKIVALATKVENLEKKMKGNPSGGGNPGYSGGGKGDRNKNNDGPPAWKTKFKTAKITHNGKEWEWCKEHKREG